MKSILLGNGNIRRVYPPECLAVLEQEAGLDPRLYTKEDILREASAAADAAYIFSTWGMPQFTEEEIARYFPKLEAVFYGAGTVQAFARPFLARGVRIFSAWGANAVPVAEYTMAQILLANKGFFQACRRCTDPEGRKAAKTWHAALPGNYGTKVGIIGAGMIGKLVIDLLRGFDLEILVSSGSMTEERAAELGVRKAALEEIFEQCQTISNHVADLPQTKGMLHGGLFRRMKPDAVFINTGRGAQVVEEDLVAVLRENPNMTAILDVTWPEPPVEGSPLYTLPNVFLTPHIAGSSGAEVQRMSQYMLEEFRRLRRGEACRWEVTENMLETMA